MALAALSAWQWQQLSALREENAGLGTRVKKLTASVRTVSPVIASRNSEAPRGGETAGGTAENGNATGPPGRPERTPEERARFQKMREMQRSQRIESRLLALTTALNLTPKQREIIQAALEKGSSERDAIREAAFTSGKPPTPDQFAASEKAQEDALLASLTSDQLGAYTQYKETEKQNRAETRANQQLNELQNSLSLTADQKDAAYQLFASQALNPATPAEGSDQAKAWEEQRQATLSAMEKILTPEQYELYQKQDAQRTEVFGNRGPGGPGGGGPGGFGGPPPP